MTCVVIGAAAGATSIRARDVRVNVATLGLLVAFALAYHGVAFGLNEIIDLPIDRTNPGRADAALVSGRASVRTAWLVVCLLGATSLGLDLIGFHYQTSAMAFLIGGYLGLIGYDLLTKRSKWPVLHDLLLALGCAALLCYSSVRTGGLTAETVVAATYIALFVILVNGVHGGLRDLHNDTLHAGPTTAAALGARLDGDGGFVLPRRLVVYAWTLNAAMGLVVVAALLTAPPRDGRVLLITGALLATVCGLVALRQGLRQRHDPARLRRFGAVHILTSYAPVMFIAALYGGWELGVVAVVVMIAPLPTNPRLRTAWGLWFRKVLHLHKTY
jgi:4-hydroxybenzoate polyprenyltransferase